jgi:RHS repeat-associated protein
VVTVNGGLAVRHGTYFHGTAAVTNSAAAAYQDVAVTAVWNPPGTNDADVISSQTGKVFVARTPEAFTYDADGNLLTDGRWTNAWDGENRLISAQTLTSVTNSGVPRVKVDLGYDYQGRRMSKVFSVWTNAAWLATQTNVFVYDGWNLVREIHAGQGLSTATNSYVWGLDLSGTIQGAGGIGGLLLRRRTLTGSTTNACLYCYDANGNVSDLARTNGALVAHYEYDAFGNTIVQAGVEATNNAFRFSTKYFLPELGLYDYGRRLYEPPLGRWVNRDSAEEDGGLNLYVFVQNAGPSFVDAFGEAIWYFVEKVIYDEVMAINKDYMRNPFVESIRLHNLQIVNSGSDGGLAIEWPTRKKSVAYRTDGSAVIANTPDNVFKSLPDLTEKVARSVKTSDHVIIHSHGYGGAIVIGSPAVGTDLEAPILDQLYKALRCVSVQLMICQVSQSKARHIYEKTGAVVYYMPGVNLSPDGDRAKKGTLPGFGLGLEEGTDRMVYNPAERRDWFRYPPAAH